MLLLGEEVFLRSSKLVTERQTLKGKTDESEREGDSGGWLACEEKERKAFHGCFGRDIRGLRRASRRGRRKMA